MLSASLCCILTVSTIHFLSNNQASCKLHYVSSFHYEDYPSVRWQMRLPPKATCHGFKYGNQPLHKLESSAAYESVLLYPAKAKALRIGYNPLLCHWNLNINSFAMLKVDVQVDLLDYFLCPFVLFKCLLI